MANVLNTENISKSLGDRLLWQDVNIGVNEGDKLGIIARNGAGKSTLLSVLAGEQSPDSGKITFRNGLRVYYLRQEPQFAPGATIATAAADYTAMLSQEQQRDSAERLGRLLTQLELPGADTPVEVLSGGQRKRFAIAAAIAAEPDFILLDEPTNHLDVATIEWLESYLSRARITLLMVTHDRYFLDSVCNAILEIDNRQIYRTEGNYNEFLRRKAERLEAMEAQASKAQNTLRREQDWISRQPQARGGKARYRIEAYEKLKEKARPVRQEKNLTLNAVSSRIGSKIFEAKHLCKRFGQNVILDDFSYVFAPGEKIGIVGDNGVGKSTLIKILQGLVPIDSGTLELGETVRFGYYSQEGIEFNPEEKVVDAVRRIAEDIDTGQGRIAPMQYLEKFLFSPADQQKFIGRLSGGERRRLYLATVLMTRPNFLVLDEPTNDLDILTLGILEDYLADFEGCVMVVSHDRYFMDRVADHLFVMEGNGSVRDFPGSYSEYRECKSAQDDAKDIKKEVKNEKPRRQRNENKLTFKEKRELETLENELDSLNREKKELEDFFASGNAEGMAEKSLRYSELKDILDEKELRWLELSEKE